MNNKTFYQISLFVFLTTFGIIASIIYYGYLSYVFPSKSSLWIFPFNTLWFIFAMTYAVFIPLIVFSLNKRQKKKLKELKKKGKL